MKLGSLIKSLLVSVTLWAAVNTAWAVTCDYADSIKPVNGSVRLQVAALTVGRDLPLGAEIYRQTFQVAPGQTPTAVCKGPLNAYWSDYTIDKHSGKADWSQGGYANKVYKTSVEGVGVAIKLGPTAVAPTQSGKVYSNCFDQKCWVRYTQINKFDLVLIKIGEVKPGRLHSSSLPTVKADGVFDETRLLGFKVDFSGGADIVSRTCSTPDVVVSMGTHQTKVFSGLNSATSWKDFVISLNNCPAFHGKFTTSPPGFISQNGWPTGQTIVGTVDANTLQFRIDPARIAINPSNGVLSLDPSTAGAVPAASGIGIQIARPNGTVLSLATNQGSSLNLVDRESSYAIPLKARYLQTGNSVTPGPANASATFTIIYQ